MPPEVTSSALSSPGYDQGDVRIRIVQWILAEKIPDLAAQKAFGGFGEIHRNQRIPVT